MAESRYRNPADNFDDAPRSGAAAARPGRIEDPLAELARLIGQEDPFKDFYKDESSRIVPPPPEPAGPPSDSWFDPQPSYAAPAEPAAPQRPTIDPPARAAAAARYDRPAQTAARPAPTPPRDTYAQSAYEQDAFAQDAFAQDAFAKEAFGRAEPARHDAAAVTRQTQAAAARTRAAADDSYYRHDAAAEYDRDYGAEEQVYDPYYSEDGQMPPHGEGLDEPPRNRARLVFMLAGAVLGLAAVGTGGVFAYRSLAGGGEPPVIKADASPNKVAPAGPPQPQDASGQKLIYDRVGAPGGGGAEKVVSREEQPVDPSHLAQPPRVVLPGAVDSSGNEPRKVRTLVVRSDGTVMPSAPASAPASPAPAAVRPVQPAPVQPAVSQPATPRPVQPAPQRTASVSGPGFVVQVSAARSEAEAQAALRSMQSKYAGVLGGQPTSVRKVELERGTFYRAHIGPFASRDQANEVCSSLKAAGGDCIVQQRN